MKTSFLQTAAIVAFGIALLLTGLGGWADLLGRSFYVSKEHAWNDGIVMMLVAIFLLLLSRS